MLKRFAGSALRFLRKLHVALDTAYCLPLHLSNVSGVSWFTISLLRSNALLNFQFFVNKRSY